MNVKPFLPLLFLLLFVACKSKKEKAAAPAAHSSSQALTKMAGYDEGYPLTDDSIDADAPYKTEEYKNHYSDYSKSSDHEPNGVRSCCPNSVGADGSSDHHPVRL